MKEHGALEQFQSCCVLQWVGQAFMPGINACGIALEEIGVSH